jgi:hypothetical protein
MEVILIGDFNCDWSQIANKNANSQTNTGRKNRFAINLHACKLVANSITNFAINLRMKCFRFATTKFTSNLQAALHNLQIYL